MENCLLCLEINRERSERISVDSSQWRKENIRYIIEKHFWTLKTLEPSEWICTICWQELCSFHLFYSRVEEVHNNLLTAIEETDDDETYAVDRSYQSDEDETGVNKINFESEEDQTNDSIYSETNTLNETQQYYEDASEQIEHESTHDSNEVPVDKLDELGQDSDTGSKYQQNEQTLESIKRAQLEQDAFISANFQLSCDLCHISLKDFSELRAHYTGAHNTAGYGKCCGKRFATRPLLVDHINLHLNPEYFKCQHCDKVLASRIILDKHMQTHKDHRVEEQTEYPYYCDICAKGYKQQAKYETHKLTHQTVEDLRCTECGKMCETTKKLYNHKRNHFVKFFKVCEICGKTLHGRNAFIAHMNVHENKFISESCDICGLILANHNALRGHKRRQHPKDGIKEYTCHICSKISPNQKALRCHIRYAHEMSANLKCTSCDKTFKRRKDWREHVATHTGTPLYTCSWCPKTFISNANMHKHHKTAHREQWEEERYQKHNAKYDVSVVTGIQELL